MGIKYRRIPILSIGRDVYLDTRLILQKLEQVAPERPRLAADSTPEHHIIERLLEVLTIDGGLFRRIVQMMPADLPHMKNEAFLKDRADLIGGAIVFTADALNAARPEAINEVRRTVQLLETLLADDRKWLLRTESPSLADIEAVWPLHWLVSVPGALPQEFISATLYPKVFCWIQRFQEFVSAAEKALPAPETMSGKQASETIVAALYNEEEGQVDENDPVIQHQNLRKGDPIQSWPTDSGSMHRDSGVLVSINAEEVVIDTTAGDLTVRLHAPRHGFRVSSARNDAGN